LVFILEVVDELGVVLFFVGKKKNQKILGEKIAKRKASSRTLIFRRPQPAPYYSWSSFQIKY